MSGTARERNLPGIVYKLSNSNRYAMGWHDLNTDRQTNPQTQRDAVQNSNRCSLAGSSGGE